MQTTLYRYLFKIILHHHITTTYNNSQPDFISLLKCKKPWIHGQIQTNADPSSMESSTMACISTLILCAVTVLLIVFPITVSTNVGSKPVLPTGSVDGYLTFDQTNEYLRNAHSLYLPETSSALFNW